MQCTTLSNEQTKRTGSNLHSSSILAGNTHSLANGDYSFQVKANSDQKQVIRFKAGPLEVQTGSPRRSLMQNAVDSDSSSPERKRTELNSPIWPPVKKRGETESPIRGNQSLDEFFKIDPNHKANQESTQKMTSRVKLAQPSLHKPDVPVLPSMSSRQGADLTSGEYGSP